jgi:hypothetical protein
VTRPAALTHIKAQVEMRAKLSENSGVPMRSLFVLAFAAALSTSVLAQLDKEHAVHHPEGTSAPAAKATPKAATAAPAQTDMQMKSMQEMHEKMMAAKTPEERQALMTEHMKSMQGGMAMMGQMKAPDAKGGGKSMSPEVMGKRMDMMEMMMQMMMDREAARTPAGK